MKRHLFAIVFILATSPAAWRATHAAEIEVYFSPNGGAAHAAAAEITAAKTSIQIEAYSISEEEITAALLAAHAKGIPIQLVVDPGQQAPNYSTADKLKKAGIRTVTDRKHQLFHNKVIIVDETTVITGSMNFTHSGNAKNAENMLIIRDPTIAAKYSADFRIHYDHSDPYIAKPFSPRHARKTPLNLLPIREPAHAQEP